MVALPAARGFCELVPVGRAGGQRSRFEKCWGWRGQCAPEQMGVRWRIVLATPLALAAMLAPENTERLRLPRRAARASGSFVKEVKRYQLIN